MEREIKGYFKAETSSVDINWSIHQCQKMVKRGKLEYSELKYMTVKKVGRRKETLLHDTFSKALSEVGM